MSKEKNFIGYIDKFFIETLKFLYHISKTKIKKSLF